jgi:hypothetical protein
MKQSLNFQSLFLAEKNPNSKKVVSKDLDKSCEVIFIFYFFLLPFTGFHKSRRIFFFNKIKRFGTKRIIVNQYLHSEKVENTVCLLIIIAISSCETRQATK